MNAVMISIQPVWVEKILSGEKTIEVRKTKPKLQVPFKCYIYETQGIYFSSRSKLKTFGLGKVTGEFVCNGVIPIHVLESGEIKNWHFNKLNRSCLAFGELAQYIGNGKIGYGWHISDLVVYDKPKELSKFYAERVTTTDYPKLTKMNRPPQSWCYVEGSEQNNDQRS